MNILLGMKILWIFFFWGGGGDCVIIKIGLCLAVISMHFRVFSLSQGTEWGIFFGSLTFRIFFFFFFGGGGGVLEIPDILGVNGRW